MGHYVNDDIRSGTRIHCLDRYTGEFKGNLPHGMGEHIFSSGASYRGVIMNNSYQGDGVYKWPNGCRYVGQWADSSCSGYGLVICPDGFEFEGFWEKDNPKDLDKGNHPLVISCIKDKICCGFVNLPQWIYVCEDCDGTDFCLTCWEECHIGMDHKYQREWVAESCCNCQRRGCNRKIR